MTNIIKWEKQLSWGKLTLELNSVDFHYHAQAMIDLCIYTKDNRKHSNIVVAVKTFHQAEFANIPDAINKWSDTKINDLVKQGELV